MERVAPGSVVKGSPSAMSLRDFLCCLVLADRSRNPLPMSVRGFLQPPRAHCQRGRRKAPRYCFPLLLCCFFLPSNEAYLLGGGPGGGGGGWSRAPAGAAGPVVGGVWRSSSLLSSALGGGLGGEGALVPAAAAAAMVTRTNRRRRLLTLDMGAAGVSEGASGGGGAPAAVLCFGEALVDRLGPPGGDPATCDASMVDDRLGGAPANVACGLARLGTPTAFVGRLGKDQIGESFGRLFSERGVDQRGLQWDTSRPSRIVLVKRDASGDRQFGGFAGGEEFADQAVDEADPAMQGHVTTHMLPQAAWLLVGTLPLASHVSAAALQHSVSRAVSCGVAVALDVNWRPTFWCSKAGPGDAPSQEVIRTKIQPVVAQASLIKLAAEEARWLFDGTTDPHAISKALPHKPAVIVTDGGGELRWCLGGAVGSMPAYGVRDIVDTTGAGDAFVAGLLHTLVKESGLLHDGGSEAKEEEVRRAMAFAAACGAIVCQGAGAIDPQPSEGQVLAFLRERGVAPPAWATTTTTSGSSNAAAA